MKKHVAGLLLFLVITVLSGCVTVMPEGISGDISPVSLNAARDNPSEYKGKQVRLGGEIAGVKVFKDVTVIEVVSRDLSRNSRPGSSDETQGRFLANIKGFLDPAVYENGRELTVTGILSGNKEQAIGEYLYQYPVVNVESHHLWKKQPETSRYNELDYWYYRPWGARYGHYWYDSPYYWGYPYYW